MVMIDSIGNRTELSSLSNLINALRHYTIQLQVSVLDSNVCPNILEKFIDQQKGIIIGSCHLCSNKNYFHPYRICFIQYHCVIFLSEQLSMLKLP